MARSSVLELRHLAIQIWSRQGIHAAMIRKQIEFVRALVYGIRHYNFFPQAHAMTSQITWILQEKKAHFRLMYVA